MTEFERFMGMVCPAIMIGLYWLSDSRANKRRIADLERERDGYRDDWYKLKNPIILPKGGSGTAPPNNTYGQQSNEAYLSMVTEVSKLIRPKPEAPANTIITKEGDEYKQAYCSTCGEKLVRTSNLFGKKCWHVCTKQHVVMPTLVPPFPPRPDPATLERTAPFANVFGKLP